VKILLIQTDLPEPVAPAIKACGVLDISISKGSLLILSPIATVNFDSAFLNKGSSIIERKLTVVDDWLGTSIPTRLVPGIGASIRISLAASAILISSCKAVILETLTPFSTDNSKRVTLGPSVTFCTSAGTLK